MHAGLTLSSTHASDAQRKLISPVHRPHLSCARDSVQNRYKLAKAWGEGEGVHSQLGGSIHPRVYGPPGPTSLGWTDRGSIHPGGSLQPPTPAQECCRFSPDPSPSQRGGVWARDYSQSAIVGLAQSRPNYHRVGRLYK